MTDPSDEGQPSPATVDEPGPEGQSELDLGVVPTGDSRVDAALAHLDALGELPVSEHPAVYDEVHRQLQATLSDPPAPGE